MVSFYIQPISLVLLISVKLLITHSLVDTEVALLHSLVETGYWAESQQFWTTDHLIRLELAGLMLTCHSSSFSIKNIPCCWEIWALTHILFFRNLLRSTTDPFCFLLPRNFCQILTVEFCRVFIYLFIIIIKVSFRRLVILYPEHEVFTFILLVTQTLFA